MRVLVVEPMKRPEIREIDGTLEAMQQLVGGTIQALYPFSDLVAIVANDDAKILGMMPNRGLRDDAGKLYDILCGTFFICGLTEDNFCSLTDDQIAKFEKMYETPEWFLKVGDHLLVLPMEEDSL